MLDQEAATGHVHRRAMLREQAKATVTCESLEVETRGAPEFHDITDDIVAIVADSGVSFGHVSIYSSHTTAAIRINENEPLLLRDMARTLRQIAPSDAYVGGGAAPESPIPGEAVVLPESEALMESLRTGDPPVIVYQKAGRLVVDLRTVDPVDDADLIEAFHTALARINDGTTPP